MILIASPTTLIPPSATLILGGLFRLINTLVHLGKMKLVGSDALLVLAMGYLHVLNGFPEGFDRSLKAQNQ